MTSPINPELDLTTGRLMTEWFEYPERTDEQLLQKAMEKYGVTREEMSSWLQDLPPDRQHLVYLAQGFIKGHRRRKWKHNMTQQEVAMRMNEATKMIDPENYKFLPDDVRERTGLEINPLWMMECLVRSGVLSPKEQIGALKELAGYTHSKAPNINFNQVTHVKPEDWLLELAKEEYQEITPLQPRTPAEKGAGPNFESRQKKKIKEVADFTNHAGADYEMLEATYQSLEFPSIDEVLDIELLELDDDE